MMVGHATTLDITRTPPKDPQPRITVRDLTCVDKDGVKRLDKVSFVANSGEILGIAGIAGSGPVSYTHLVCRKWKQSREYHIPRKLKNAVLSFHATQKKRARSLNLLPDFRGNPYGSYPIPVFR